MQKYIGRTVEIIYIDRHSKFTKRTIKVRAVEGNTVKAYCLDRKAPRIFKLDDILAVQPVIGRAN